MTFKFAAAVSQHPSLYQAIAEVVQGCRQGLEGRLPDFCQLLITTSHARNIAHAPKCLLDKLVRLGGVNSETLPVVMGGVLQSVSGPGEHISSGSGVSLLAASLPGVELMPFHVDTPALPQLSAQQWSRLLTNVSHRQPRPRSSYSSTHIHVDSDSEEDESSSSTGVNSTATIMLSSPHFTEVERLLQRFSNVLPGMPVLGGVTEQDAWLETEHSFGALFLGGRVFCQGAVGCVMHGPLAVQQLLVPGCQPAAGKVMTVTQVAGNVIMSLDGRPVKDSVVSLVQSLPESQRTKQLKLGIDEVGLGSPPGGQGYDARVFVARNMQLAHAPSTQQPVLVAATHEVPLGSRVQLLVQDFDRCQQQQRQELRALVSSLPPAASRDPSQFGLLSYGCVALPHDDAQLVEDIWPKVPFAGGRMQGEFAGPAATGCPTPDPDTMATPTAKLHSFAATTSLICHQDALQS